LVALVCYEVTRSALVTQRERVAERQAYVNARAVDNALTSDPDDPTLAVAAAQTSGQGFALLRANGEWFRSSVTGSRQDVPASMVAVLEDGAVARQRVSSSAGTAVAVGVPLVGPSEGTWYVEFVPM